MSDSLQPHGLYFQLLKVASFGDDNPKTFAVLCTMIVKLKCQVTPERISHGSSLNMLNTSNIQCISVGLRENSSLPLAHGKLGFTVKVHL